VDGDATPEAIFALRGRPHAITLGPEGIHHPRTPRGRGFAYTPYEEVTHLASSHRALWIGTRRSVYVLARRSFVDPHGPEHLVRALLARIAGRPGGAAQLARMADIEEVARAAEPARATWGLGLLCLLVFVLQLAAGNVVHEVGYYSPALVADGDLWRLVTANLLHALPEFPLHLVLNLIALLALGTLTERPLGTARTVVVMGVSGLAAMLASGLASEADVVGVSGVVYGLAGAVLWLELRCANRLPAWWRVPRRALIGLLILNLAISFVVPVIASAAHVGGFLAGVVTTALVAERPIAARRASVVVQAASALVAVALVASLGAAAVELLRPGDFSTRHTERLARLPGISPLELNNRAWFIAIDPRSTPEHLEAALLLAERAVSETDRREPTLLDTLAELQFQLGHEQQALQTIDEAIVQAPGEAYYREQRRRFLGERSREDRPEPPLPWETEPAPATEAPGITV
jgi:membrane associated rhomboid family serine protease